MSDNPTRCERCNTTTAEIKEYTVTKPVAGFAPDARGRRQETAEFTRDLCANCAGTTAQVYEVSPKAPKDAQVEPLPTPQADAVREDVDTSAEAPKRRRGGE